MQLCTIYLMSSNLRSEGSCLSSYVTPSNVPQNTPQHPWQRSPSIVMRHLEPCPLEPTLNIEPFVRLAAIQNRLVTPDLLRDKVQCLNNPEPQLLALLVLCNRNVFNVPDKTQLVDELALDDQRAGANDARRGIEDGEKEVGVVARGHPCVPLVPCLWV